MEIKKNHRCLVPLTNLGKCRSFRGGTDNVEYGNLFLLLLLSTQYWWFKIINNSEFSIKWWASKDDYLCVSFYCKTSIFNITSIISRGVFKKLFQTSIKTTFWINRKVFPSRIDSICNESIFAKFIFLFLLINWSKLNVFKLSLFLRIRWSIISIKLVNIWTN